MTIQKITNVSDIETIEEQWWFLYDESTEIVFQGPFQCSGSTTSPHIMVIGDTEEELLTYIKENDLILPTEEDNYDLI